MNIRLDEGNRLVVSKASRNQVLIEGIHLKNVVVSKWLRVEGSNCVSKWNCVQATSKIRLFDSPKAVGLQSQNNDQIAKDSLKCAANLQFRLELTFFPSSNSKMWKYARLIGQRYFSSWLPRTRYASGSFADFVSLVFSWTGAGISVRYTTEWRYATSSKRRNTHLVWRSTCWQGNESSL